jgi:hypothetical protein
MTRRLCAYAGRVRAVVLMLVACVVAVASASNALAAAPGQSYSHQADVGTPDAAASATFYNPVATSTDDGNVFLLRPLDPNSGDGEVDVLNATGSSLTRVDLGGFVPGGVAVSADGSDLFVTASNSTSIRKFVSDGAPTPTYAEDPSWQAGALLIGRGGIAVDPSSGELVVADGSSGSIYHLDAATGAVLSSFDGSTTPGGKFVLPTSLAVAGNGDVYVLAGRVEHMGADGTWKGKLDLGPWSQSIINGVAVNPQNGDVAVELAPGPGANDTVILIYSAANVLKDTIRVPPTLVNDNSGLAFAADGSKLYVALKDGSAHVYARGTRPGLDAPAFSQITADGAHLTSSVATGGDQTTARFEYCLASDPCPRFLTTDGSSPWHPLADQVKPADPDHAIVYDLADDLTGLAPNTRYLVRVHAVDDDNQVETLSDPTSFSTLPLPPEVTTGSASDVTDSSVALTGSVDNTFGAQTTYRFEYGTTTSYGSVAPSGASGVAGSLRTPRTFTEVVDGLAPGTTYHYRLVATNSAGITAGADRTFTTLATDQRAPVRGYEEVTAPNKNGLDLQANWGFQAAANGSAIEYAATAPTVDSASAAVTARFISRRETKPGGQTDWIGPQPLDPPFSPARAIVNSVTQAVSDDFKHALVFSQVALAPGATEGFTNIYVKDLDSGAYHFVGTAKQGGAFVGMTGIQLLNTFIAGASDFSWVVLISRYPLLPGAPQVAMYKWTRAGGLSLISRLPNGSMPSGDAWYQAASLSVNRLVSDDGNIVAFSLKTGEGGVYRREGGQTTAISVSQANPTVTEPGQVDGMSRDGRFVVFHSPSQLTNDDQDGGLSEYSYDAKAPSQPLEYLGPQDGTDDGARDVLGISDDGRTVYFNSNNHLVVWRNGQTAVVSSDAIRQGASYGYPSPNGRYFEFVGSDRAVHLYDADTGTATCLSCRSDGSPTAGGLPGPDRNMSNRFAQVVTDDGHAYFDTTTALLNSDRNGSRDVYEYYHGRLTLISPGDRAFTATLVDISADGGDVFFSTAEGLVSQDTDQSYDLYDARVGGGIGAQNPPSPDAPCAKSECSEPGPGPVASPPVGSLPQPQDKPAKRTNQAKVKVSLSRVSIGSKTMKITFHASQRGRLKVSGSRVVTTYRNVTKEGTFSVSVPLSKKARSLVRHKKKFKLAVKVSLAGGWGTSSFKYSRTLGK